MPVHVSTGRGGRANRREERWRVLAAVDDPPVAPDDLGRLVAISPGERRVDVGHDAVEAVHRDRVGGLLDGGGQPRALLFRGTTDADVADRGGDEDAVGALERAEHDLDRELAAVLAPADELDAGADLLGKRLGGRPEVVGDQPLGEPARG